MSYRKILFESEIFNKEMKGTYPFRIKVKEIKIDSAHQVEVIREDYKKVNDSFVVSKENILNSTFWKD